MKRKNKARAGLDFAHPSTATRPTNLRVRIWRKLQKLGAVAIKNSVYVLLQVRSA